MYDSFVKYHVLVTCISVITTRDSSVTKCDSLLFCIHTHIICGNNQILPTGFFQTLDIPGRTQNCYVIANLLSHDLHASAVLVHDVLIENVKCFSVLFFKCIVFICGVLCTMCTASVSFVETVQETIFASVQNLKRNKNLD